MNLKDEKDIIWAVISVVPSKYPGSRDILLIDNHDENISFRSITELMNFLQKKKVSYEDRREVLDFIANSLIILEKINFNSKMIVKNSGG